MLIWVEIDLIGPLPITNDGNKYIVTMIDYLANGRRLQLFLISQIKELQHLFIKLAAGELTCNARSGPWHVTALLTVYTAKYCYSNLMVVCK